SRCSRSAAIAGRRSDPRRGPAPCERSEHLRTAERFARRSTRGARPPGEGLVSLTLDEARALHDEICVLDLHADTAKLMDKLGYDLALRHERPLPRRMSVFGHVDLPRLREGGVAGQFFSFWTNPYPERGCTRSVV